MHKWLLALIPCLLAAQPAKPPKLVLAIVIDQFRYDYLTRFRADYSGGLAHLLSKGAVFTNANYEQIPTVTAVGHSLFLSGAPPSMSGIVGNEWFDRESGRRVTSVSDESVQLLGATGRGASPKKMLQSTLGDELKMSGKGGKVIGISLKDRSAILPVGRMADAAYWFSDNSGNFVSSTYYFPQLPGWVADFNKLRPADRYLNAEWPSLFEPGKIFRKLAAKPDRAFYTSIEKTPFGNDLVEEFAERAIDAEQIGRDERTDLLAVSFSANDYLGHDVGPGALEIRDMCVRTDRLLGKLFKMIDAKVGLASTIIVLTADHGVAPVPDQDPQRRMPGGWLVTKEFRALIEKAMAARLGEGPWVQEYIEGSLYLDYGAIEKKGLQVDAVERVAAMAARAMPSVFRVYTRSQFMTGAIGNDRVDMRARNGFNARRSADLVVIPEPYWMNSSSGTGTNHYTPFSYDSHVPLMFTGPGIRAGIYYKAAAIHDIAITLAAILQLETPSGSVGRVLDEIIP